MRIIKAAKNVQYDSVLLANTGFSFSQNSQFLVDGFGCVGVVRQPVVRGAGCLARPGEHRDLPLVVHSPALQQRSINAAAAMEQQQQQGKRLYLQDGTGVPGYIADQEQRATTASSRVCTLSEIS